MPRMFLRTNGTWYVIATRRGVRHARIYVDLDDALADFLESAVWSLSSRVPSDRTIGGRFTVADTLAWMDCADELLALAVRRRT